MRLLALTCLVLCACPPPAEPVDSGVEDSGHGEPEDAGPIDAGHDAGRPPRPDAGVDAGWVNVTEAQWCQSLALARCWRDLRCLRIDATRIDDCVARNLQTCDNAAYLTGSRFGMHHFDPDAGAACLNAYDYGSCEQVPDACGTVFTGLVPPDGGAFAKEDCDPDAGYFYAAESICPRRCRPWSGLGERCYDSVGSYTSSCKPGVHSCEYEDGGTGSPTVCVPPLREGDRCGWYYSCGPNQVCTGSQCMKQVATLGESCEVKNGYPDCDSETLCRRDNDAGVCVRRSGLGGACVGFQVNYVQTCLPSLRCSSAIGTGTCLARAAIGETCSSTNSTTFYPNDCMDGLYCNYATSRCRELPGDGGDCSSQGSSDQCRPNHYCDYFGDERCYPTLDDGQECDGYDDWCKSGDCVYGPRPDGGGNGYRCVRCSATDGG